MIDGEVHHDDSSGSAGMVRAGQVQAMSAGTGVNHREQNPRSTRLWRGVIQMWLPPNESGGEPAYRTADVPLDGRGLVLVASGIAGHEPAVAINNDAAALYAARARRGGIGPPSRPRRSGTCSWSPALSRSTVRGSPRVTRCAPSTPPA